MSGNSAPPLPKGLEAELVLQRLRSDKSLEALQQDALRRLRDNPEFNQRVQKLVANSEAIKKEGPRRQTKLREELEDQVVEEAVMKFWDILNSRDQGIALTIESYVQAALMDVLAEQESGPDR